MNQTSNGTSEPFLLTQVDGTDTLVDINLTASTNCLLFLTEPPKKRKRLKPPKSRWVEKKLRKVGR